MSAATDRRAQPVCPSCDGTSWKPNPEGRGVVRCECWASKLAAHAAGVPREFHDAKLANYRDLKGNKAAKKAALAFLDGDRDLFLCGGVGGGKTRLAASILNTRYEATRDGFFVRVPLLLRDLQPTQDDARAEAAGQLEQRLRTESVIVLDDLGAERDGATDYTRRTVFDLYEARHDQGLRTIWTSNLRLDCDTTVAPDRRPPTLAEYMRDDRLASRIAGWADVVLLTTPDQRIALRDQKD